jgi:predicted permease
LSERFAATPGVETAGFAMGTLPMAGDAVVGFWPHGKPRPEKNDELYRAQYYTVNGDYFQAMRIRLIRGREFTREDDSSVSPVAVVDEDIANRIFSGQNPVGQQIEFGPTSQSIQIVGVVEHVKHWGLDGEGKSPYSYEIYLPYAQIPDAYLPQSAHFTWAVVRTKVAPLSLAASLRNELAAADRGAALYALQTMDGAISDSLGQRRFLMALLTIFAGVALILATIGVYGVVSYLVGLRTREIGIRMAMGAQRRDVLRLVFSQNGSTVLAGIGLGLIASVGLMQLMSSMLFGISATDPLTFTIVVAILCCVALLACWIPARRATRVDPTVALRYE